MNVLTDALLAVRYRDADVGVFSFVRHQVICLLMATCSSGLFACTRSTDEQGNFTLLYINNYCKLLSELLFVQRNVFQLKKKGKERNGLYRACVAGIGVLLCAMCLSVRLLCL